MPGISPNGRIINDSDAWPEEGAMSNERLGRWLGPLGLGSVVAFIIGFFILGGPNPPGKNASNAAVVLYYTAHSTRQTWSVYVVAAGVILMAFFIGGMRSVLRRANPSHTWLADVAFGGGLVFVAGFATLGFVQWSLISAVHNGQAQLAGNLNFLAQTIPVPAQAGLVVLAAAAGLTIVLGSDLPAWLGYSALAIAVVSAIGPIGLIAVAVTPLWMTVLGFIVGSRAPATQAFGQPSLAVRRRMTVRHHH
jgi:hypothetical protein